MNRAYKIQRRMMEQIASFEKGGMARDTSLNWERIHLVSCSRNGHLLASKRGFDAELASIACSVHDYGRIVTGKHPNHAAAGHEPLLRFLLESDLLHRAEIEAITVAAKNHSDKEGRGTPLEEIVKDADVLDYHFYGIPIQKDAYRRRLDSTLSELGL